MQNRRKAASPMEAIQDAMDVMIEATYEDSEATPEELSLAHRRFENAVKYISALVYDEKFLDVMSDIERLRQRVTDLELSNAKK